MTIRKVAAGAYFVPSYSEQTIARPDPLRTSLPVAIEEEAEDVADIEVEADPTVEPPSAGDPQTNPS